MATQVIIQPYYAGSIGHLQRWTLGGPEYPLIKETAAQTYGAGDLVYGDANGTIAICTVDGGTPTLLNSQVAGQASKAATGTTGSSVLLFAIRNDERFFMNIHHETPASAVGAQTDLFDQLAVCKSGGFWKASKDAAAESASLSNGHVTVIGFALRHPVGGTIIALTDIYPLAMVKFNTWSIATDGNPNQRVLQLSG